MEWRVVRSSMSWWSSPAIVAGRRRRVTHAYRSYTLLLCGAGLAGLWFSAFVKSSLPASIITGAFTTLALFFLFRFIFSTGRKLQRSGIIATAVAFTVAGVAMLVGSFFADQISHRFYLLSLGASGVGGGVLNFLKAKSRSRPPENNARDVT